MLEDGWDKVSGSVFRGSTVFKELGRGSGVRTGQTEEVEVALSEHVIQGMDTNY